MSRRRRGGGYARAGGESGRARQRGGAAPGGQRNEEKGSALALPSSASLRCTDSYSSRAFAISVWAPATEARRIDFWLRTTVPRHALSVTCKSCLSFMTNIFVTMAFLVCMSSIWDWLLPDDDAYLKRSRCLF